MNKSLFIRTLVLMALILDGTLPLKVFTKQTLFCRLHVGQFLEILFSKFLF